MEYVFVLLVLVLVLLFFAVVILVTYILYKKKQNKKEKQERGEEKIKEKIKLEGQRKDFLRTKRPSEDSFMIPFISVPEQIPFSIEEDPIQSHTLHIDQTKKYNPPASSPFVPKYFRKKRKRQKKQLSRSISCPSVGLTISEENDDEENEDDGNESGSSTSSNSVCTQNVLQQTTIRRNVKPLYASEGNLLHPQNQQHVRQNNFKKSTRDLLETPRKMSVYQDTTMDVNQLTLARRRGSALIQEESFKKVGMIHFSTEFLEEEKVFQVCVGEVSDLMGHLNAQINPFVRLYLSSHKKCKHDTKVLHNTRYPVFNEYFEFPNIKQEDLHEQKLRIKLYTQDVIKRKELLGQVDVLLSSLSLIGRETFDVFLFKERSTVSMTSVCLTLCHQATMSRLDVLVEKLKKVPKPPKGSISSSIYGSCTLYKDAKEWKRNTSIKPYHKDPVYEETLSFQDLNTSSSNPLNSYSLVFSLVERSLMGHDKILGQILLSDTSPQFSGAKHWGNVHDNPHIKHTSWHYLLDPDEFI